MRLVTSSKLGALVCVTLFFGTLFLIISTNHEQVSRWIDISQRKAWLEFLNTLIRVNHRNSVAFCYRAAFFNESGNLDEALLDANKAIELAPTYADAYVERAAVNLRKACYEIALVDCKKAISLDIRDVRAHLISGLAYMRLKRYSEAVDAYDKVIDIEPNSFSYYINRASALGKSGLNDRAIQDLDKACVLAPKELLPYLERGRFYYQIGRFQNAVEDFSKAIKVSPNSVDGYILRASCYQALGRLQKQIDDLSFAIKLRPDDSRLLEQRAYAFYRLFKLTQSVNDSKSILTKEPNSVAAASTAALAFETQGQYEEAIKMRNILLLANKEIIQQWSSRARNFELLGRPALADADWHKSHELSSPEDQLQIQLCNPFLVFGANKIENRKRIVDKNIRRDSVVIQFKLDNENHLRVPVQLNKRHQWLILDTGCGHSEIQKESVSEALLGGESKVRLRATKANGDEYEFGVLRVKDFRLGEFELGNVAIAIDRGLETGLCGLLGGNILENFVVTVDYRNKQVVLSEAGERNRTRNAIILPMLVRNHCPYCIVRLDGKIEVAALLDTGCPFSNAADSLLEPLLARRLKPTGHLRGPWLGELSVETVKLKTISFGTFNIDLPLFDVFRADKAPTAAEAVTLGNDILSKFKTITFDYPGRKVIFEP